MVRFLCSWRQHVVETQIEKMPVGETKWKRGTICTSLQTFLGRKHDKGGIIGIVANTPTKIDSVPSHKT